MTIRKRHAIIAVHPVEAVLTCLPRYSEFQDLREKLLTTFPNSGAAMPPLPPKSVFCKWLLHKSKPQIRMSG